MSGQRSISQSPSFGPNIRSVTVGLLLAVGKTSFQLPGKGRIHILERLAHLGRSGKSIRIDLAGLTLPKRSVLDHILSLAVQADLLHGLGFRAPNPCVLAKCIAFHDIAEAIIGDTPDFTSEMIASKHYVSARDKPIATRRANRLIAEHLDTATRCSFLSTIALLHTSQSRTRQYFEMLDKTDPIIAIWRYLAALQHRMIPAGPFLAAMDDFFTNPLPQKSCVHQEILDLIRFLQNKGYAERYSERSLPTVQEMANNKLFSLFEQLVSHRESMHYATSHNGQPANWRRIVLSVL
jgi:5'-deoxynucleotidase YfbR-like HD superfamily hydrolase